MSDPKIKILRIEELSVADIAGLTTSALPITGYVKPGSTSAITATDTINVALGKLEKGVEDASATGGGDSWGDIVDADIIPDNDNVRDLGTSVNEFKTLYIKNIITDTLKLGTGPGSTRNVIMLSNGDLSHTALGGNATDIAVTGTPTNYTPGSPNSQSYFEAIDTALGSIGSGTITAENQRKIDNARDFIIYTETGDIAFDSADIVNSVASNENKKPILTYSGTNSGIITMPAGLGVAGQSIIVDNDGTGKVEIIPASGVTFIGSDLSGSKDSIRMDGAVSGQEYGRVTLVQKSTNIWRVDGNYLGFANISDFFPQDNAASADDVNATGSWTVTGAGAIFAVESTIVDTDSYSLRVGSTGAPCYVSRTISGLTENTTYNVAWRGYESTTSAYTSVRIPAAGTTSGSEIVTVADGAAWNDYNTQFTTSSGSTSITLQLHNAGSVGDSYFNQIIITEV